MKTAGLALPALAIALATAAAEKKSPTATDLPAELGPRRVRMRAGTRPATPDLLAAVWRCSRCKSDNAAERLLPEQPPFDQLRDVRLLLDRVVLGRGRSWKPPPLGRCRICGAPAGRSATIREVLLFRYLPATGGDAVARAAVHDGRAGALKWGRLDVTGDYDEVGTLETPGQFLKAFGRVLVLREAWSQTVRECIRKGEARALKTAPGYYVTCRKRSADADTDARFAAELNIRLAKAGEQPTRMLRVALTDVTGSGLAKVIPTYRRWMPGQRAQLEGGTYSAAAYIRPRVFWALLDREIRHSGVRLVHPPEAAAPHLVAGDYRASMASEAVLLKTVHSGLAFGEGLHHFAWPLVLKLSKMQEVGRQARDALGAYETSVENGKFLAVREKPAPGAPAASGQLLARINVHALAGSVNPRRPNAVTFALRGLLGLDPASGLIRPPDLDTERGPDGTRCWLTRKLRPRGYFEKLGIEVLANEWRGLSAAWSLDCLEYSRFLPQKDPPSDQKLRKRFEKDLSRSTFWVPGAKGLNWEGIRVRAAIGPDIASALTHERLRRGLARHLKITRKGVDVVFWAPDTNVVLLTSRPVTGRSRTALKKALPDLLRSVKIQPGHEIDVEIRERLTAEPAGRFLRLKASRSAPPQR